MKKLLCTLLASLMILSGCSKAPAQSEGMKAGTYKGTAEGFHGTVELEVTVDAEKITDIQVVQHSETEGIGAAALPVLIENTLNAQSYGIDNVSGASITSGAFKEAVKMALSEAGADLEKMSQPVASGETAEETLDYDIVVVGGGAAGLTAALSAVQNEKDVLLIEKTGVVGGASAMAGAGTKAVGSKWSLESGDTYTADDLIEDMLENGHHKNDLDTLKIFAYNNGEAFDWLVAEDGANVPYVRKEGVSHDFSGDGRGAGVVKTLSEHFTEQGGDLMVSTPATELIVNDGKVTGVKAEGNGKNYTINAGAVILATGGYGNNEELVPEEYKKLVYAGHAGATGDAIELTKPLNADLLTMDLINTQPNSMIKPSGLGQYTNPGVNGAYKAGAYLVNQDGVRFFNEQGNSWDLIQAMKANDFQYLIMDQTAFDNFNNGMFGSKIYTQEDVDQWLKDDYDGQPKMYTASTLEELAAKVNVPAEALSESHKKYNEDFAKGTEDEFGRTIAAEQSEEGPYYALQLHVRYYASLGGLHINDHMQVLNTDQQAIEGLYAAGEVVGGVEGDIYMGGTLFGWACTSGYTAGNFASESVK